MITFGIVGFEDNQYTRELNCVTQQVGFPSEALSTLLHKQLPCLLRRYKIGILLVTLLSLMSDIEYSVNPSTPVNLLELRVVLYI